MAAPTAPRRWPRQLPELPEYYQTRTEHALLCAIADRVADTTSADMPSTGTMTSKPRSAAPLAV